MEQLSGGLSVLLVVGRVSEGLAHVLLPRAIVGSPEDRDGREGLMGELDVKGALSVVESTISSSRSTFLLSP